MAQITDEQIIVALMNHGTIKEAAGCADNTKHGLQVYAAPGRR